MARPSRVSSRLLTMTSVCRAEVAKCDIWTITRPNNLPASDPDDGVVSTDDSCWSSQATLLW